MKIAFIILCFNVLVIVQTEGCEFSANPEDANSYIHAGQVMPCGPGTSYNPTTCGCHNFVDVAPTSETAEFSASDIFSILDVNNDGVLSEMDINDAVKIITGKVEEFLKKFSEEDLEEFLKNISEEDLAAIKVAFDRIHDQVIEFFQGADTDNSGNITLEEFKPLYEEYRAAQMTRNIFDVFDVDKDGKLTMADYNKTFDNIEEIFGTDSMTSITSEEWKEKGKGKFSEEHIDLVIETFDINHDNVFDDADMKALADIFDHADIDGNGEITFQEFKPEYEKHHKTQKRYTRDN